VVFLSIRDKCSNSRGFGAGLTARPEAPSYRRVSPRSMRIAIGLAASLALAVLIAVPLGNPKAEGTGSPRGSASSLQISAAREARLQNEALSAATSLAATLTQLARLREQRARGTAASGPPEYPPPSVTTFASTGACLASFLPKLEPLAPENLEFICSQSDLWAMERQAQRLMAGKPGPAAELWRRFGSYELAALAVMRSGCCPDAEPLTAVVPGLWCGILRDKVRLFSAMPERTTVSDFERTMTCLARRGTVLPAHWATVPAGRGQRAFEEFLAIAWARR
jgi:hypothetical protein